MHSSTQAAHGRVPQHQSITEAALRLGRSPDKAKDVGETRLEYEQVAGAHRDLGSSRVCVCQAN